MQSVSFQMAHLVYSLKPQVNTTDIAQPQYDNNQIQYSEPIKLTFCIIICVVGCHALIWYIHHHNIMQTPYYTGTHSNIHSTWVGYRERCGLHLLPISVASGGYILLCTSHNISAKHSLWRSIYCH